MKLRIRRIILFAKDVPALLKFYRDVLGLRVLDDQSSKGWADLDGGGCRLALHRGRPLRAAKIAFYTKSVPRDRDRLVQRGATMGSVKEFGRLRLCDGRDPEGNAFQLSNRP